MASLKEQDLSSNAGDLKCAVWLETVATFLSGGGKKKKKVHLLFSLEGKLKWHISMTATNNFVLFLFHFSCAHMKCEIIALNILASLAEQLTVASFITYYLTDASNTESVNLIMV